VFAFDNTELGCTDLVQHIIITGDNPPIRQRQWNRYSKEENDIISKQVQEILDFGVIKNVILHGHQTLY